MITKLVMVACFILAISGAQASFVSPLQVDVTNNQRGHVTVTNDTLSPAIYEVSIAAWGGDGEPLRESSLSPLIVMPAIVRLHPGEHQEFSVVFSAAEPTSIQAYRLIIKETTETPENNQSLQLTISYSLPMYVWPESALESLESDASADCRLQSGAHQLINTLPYPIRVSSLYEDLVPLTDVLLPGQILETSNVALPINDCQVVYEPILPSRP